MILLDIVAEVIMIRFRHIDVGLRCDLVLGCKLKRALQM